MKTRKGEPVIVVPEEQQQIVELERQLAERDRRIAELAAEGVRLREALKKTIIYGGWDNYDKGTLWCICTCCKADGGYTQEEYDQKDYLVVQHIKGCEAVAALATTPHAAKAAERVKKLENAVQAGRDYRDWVEVGCPDVGHDVLTPEQHFEFALDTLDATEGGEV